MKTKLKTTYLLGLSLLAGVLCIPSLNLTDAVVIDVDGVNSASNTHRARVYTLFLGDSGTETGAWIKMPLEGDRLDILNGFFVSSLSGTSSTGTLVVIGGGSGNSIQGNVSNSGIGGGVGNKIDGSNSSIGGGARNTVGDSSVVVGGQMNIAENGGVVGGGYNNRAKHAGTIILGNDGETYGSNALLLSNAAKGGTGSFVWRNVAGETNPIENFARIGSTSGILIGTYKPIANLSLVVSGAVKIGGDSNSQKQKGEILVDGGCIYVYDNQNGKRNAVGRTSRKSGCDVGSSCVFGRTLLQDGESAPAYTKYYSNNCNSVKVQIKCNNGTLSRTDTYPYCNQLNS